MTVPPELQQVWDEAVAANQRSSTAGPGGSGLERDAAVAAWQAIIRHEAFDSAPPPFRAVVFHLLGLALHLRAVAGGAPTDIDEAITAFETAVATVPTDSALRAAYLGNLGYALLTRLSHGATTTDRDAAIAAFESALQGTPADSPKRPGFLDNLGVLLGRRFESNGAPADIDASIRAFEEALELTPVGSPDRPGYLANLGTGLRNRFEARGVSADLDAAIVAHQAAVDATPAEDPDRSARLNKLGLGLRVRYDHGRASADLDASIEAIREAVDSPADDPERPARLVSLGDGLQARFARSKVSTDLDSAIAAFQTAVTTSLADAPGRPDRLDSLGQALLERYSHGGAPADLEAAIAAFSEAVDTSTADDPGRPSRLTNLGNSLQDRYTRTGAPTDLDAAIKAREEALKTPSNERDRALYLSNLGVGLLDRHFRTGSQADLDAAIAAYEEAVEIDPDDAAGQRIRRNNLGAALMARYSRTGSMADLEAVTAISEELVDGTPAGDPLRPVALNNMGNALRERYIRKGALADVEAAIALFQEALEAVPPGSPERPKTLANVGESLRVRYDAKADLPDLEAAIVAFQQALDATPAEAPWRPRYLEDMGGGLLARYRRTRIPGDLEAAITALHEAIDATPADSPYRISRVTNLGFALIDHYGRTTAVADLEAAVKAFREACRLGLAIAPAIALGSAQAWGAWASDRGSWAEAAEAYGHGLAAIDRLYQSQLLPGGKQTWLGAAQGLAVAAAYALARIGAPAAAILALERGRARVLTEAVQRDRADLADIAALDPVAYAAYEEAAAKLRALESQERAGGTGLSEAPSTPPRGDLQEQARRARLDLDAAIGRIQQIPGHARYGVPATIEEVAGVAEPGCPVVALVTTPAGSVALLVSRFDEAAAPMFEAIWAPELTTTVLNELLTTVRDGRVVGGYLAGQVGDQDALETALADGLPKVGTSLIGPVAARLRELGASGVVLLPTGLLGLLPLHAAPYPVEGETRCLLDEFDVSHTPGALVLRAARAALAAREEAPPVLVGVGNPQPHPQPLAFARAELEEVARFFPDGASHPLYETAATETALVGLLPQATHVHLACHGRFDADTPLDSCLELARPDASEPAGDEGRVRLEEILANDWFGHTRLVVLSACQTAITDARRLPDEAIGLPAGLLQAGVPSVIGTLWSVDDLSTTLLMTQFYAYHREGDPATDEGPLPPAAALRRAQGWLKTRTADDLVTLLAAHRSMATVAEQRHGTRMSAAEAGAGILQLGLEASTSRPFAEPYYWAPFVAIGA